MTSSSFNSRATFAVFWLVIFAGLVKKAFAVRCTSCNDNIGSEHDTANCPMITTVTENVAALVAGATTIVSVAQLLPTKILRALPRAVLDAIKSLCSRPMNAPFNYDGASVKEIFQAVMAGRASPDEASIHLHMKIMDASATEVNRIAKTMDIIKTMGPSRYEAACQMQGAHLYVWAVTAKCAHDTDAAVLNAMLDAGSDGANTAHVLKLERPRSYHDFVRRLNLWVMLLHATGVENALTVTAFLDEVVYPELAKGRDWKVVHELFVIYLRCVEESTGVSLGSVFTSGGQDTKMKEAEAAAITNFRGGQGDPAGSRAPTGGTAQAWNCAFDSNATRPCISYNLKRDHPFACIENGRCKFLHKCDRFVRGADGARTTCGATNHCRVNCTNPAKIEGE
jgi:hypothetical protein